MDQLLRDARSRGDLILIVHYACENLHNATDHPPAVGCIVVKELGGGQTRMFSRNESPTGTDATTAEADLLTRYFDYMKGRADAAIIHWNMSRPTYGFGALESRFRYLSAGDPTYSVPPSRVADLDDLIAFAFGEDYAEHPKLYNLAALNGLSTRYALRGKEEAEAFDRSDFGAVDRSTAEKVDWIDKLAVAFLDGVLVTQRSVGSVEFAEARIDAVVLLEELAERFLYVQRELKNRYGGRPPLTFTDEYDDQDLLRAILRVFFDDVRAEEWTPSYAGAASRIDFLLPDVAVAVELKHMRATLDAKKIGDQLIVDVARYSAHQDIRHLVCIVFDHDGLLQNPRGLEEDLARDASNDGFAVTVVIVDR
jgi:hypothetical protein